MVTTLGSSKDGGLEGVGMSKQTDASNKFTNYWRHTTQSSQSDTSTLTETLLMVHREASTHQHTSYFPQSKSLTKSNPSSSTLTHPPDLARELLLEVLLHHQKQHSPPQSANEDNKRMQMPTTPPTNPPKHPHLINTLNRSPSMASLETPELAGDNPHIPSLKPSALHPPCLAGERIRRWKPENSRSSQ